MKLSCRETAGFLIFWGVIVVGLIIGSSLT